MLSKRYFTTESGAEKGKDERGRKREDEKML
jgi:hypothetical protein